MRMKGRSRVGRGAGRRPSARRLDADQLTAIAARFRALGEPSRLRLLDVLREGERSVGELMAATGCSQPNASRHLQLLHQHGLVRRRKAGVSTYYRLADNDVLRLCDLMCRRLAAEAAAHHEWFAG